MSEDGCEAGDVVAGQPQFLQSLMGDQGMVRICETIVAESELCEVRQLGQQHGHRALAHLVTVQYELAEVGVRGQVSGDQW